MRIKHIFTQLYTCRQALHTQSSNIISRQRASGGLSDEIRVARKAFYHRPTPSNAQTPSDAQKPPSIQTPPLIRPESLCSNNLDSKPKPSRNMSEETLFCLGKLVDVIISLFLILSKGSRQKRRRVFYGQADHKG